VWRDRDVFLTGRQEILAFLTGKWQRELDYALRKSLWGFRENRIGVRFQYEWRDAARGWWRSYGNELWEFDERGLMCRREASINDVETTARTIEATRAHPHEPTRGPRAGVATCPSSDPARPHGARPGRCTDRITLSNLLEPCPVAILGRMIVRLTGLPRSTRGTVSPPAAGRPCAPPRSSSPSRPRASTYACSGAGPTSDCPRRSR